MAAQLARLSAVSPRFVIDCRTCCITTTGSHDDRLRVTVYPLQPHTIQRRLAHRAYVPFISLLFALFASLNTIGA
ncbi:hypothetical protein BDW66DRAFT_142816 [Aspergillus desertorum]